MRGHSRFVVIQMAALALALMSGVAPVRAVITLTPVVDGEVSTAFGGPLTAFTGMGQVSQLESSTQTQRGVLEFDLTQLPSGTVVSSAQLKVIVRGWAHNTVSGISAAIDVSAYVGDGNVSVPDYFNNANLIGSSLPISDFGLLTINLQPGYIQSLLSTHQHYLGLLTLGRPVGFQSSFASTEYAAQFPTLYTPPTLAINVPEPGIAVMLAALIILPRVHRQKRISG